MGFPVQKKKKKEKQSDGLMSIIQQGTGSTACPQLYCICYNKNIKLTSLII
jgi:hypothetical protein